LFTEADCWPDLAYRPLSTPGLSSEHDRFLPGKGFVMRIYDLIYVKWHVVNAVNVLVIITTEIVLLLNRKVGEEHIWIISRTYILHIYFFKTCIIDHCCA